MKANISVMIFAYALLMAENAFAFADYDSITNKINITIDEPQYIDVMVTEEDADLDKIGETDEIGGLITPFYIKQFKPGENIEIPMPEDAESGLYSVYVGENQEAELTFLYVNRSEAEEYVSEVINKTASADALRKAIEDGYLKIGVKFETEDNDGDISCLLYAQRPFENYEAFLNKFNNARINTEVKNAPDISSFEKLIEENQTELGIEYSKYNELSGAEKEKVYSFIKNGDFVNNSFSDIYAEAVAVARCACARHWSELKSAIIASADVLGVSLTGNYSHLTDTSGVYIRMINQTDTFTSAAAVKEAFDKAVAALLGGGGGTGGNSGGGSSGGSSPGAGLTVTPAVVNEKPLDTDNAISFTDLENVEWAREAIDSLVKIGAVKGKGGGIFDPESPVTRAEFASMIFSAFKIEEGECDFEDVSNSDWYKKPVGALCKAGIVKGDGNLFRPDDKITREDAAVILFRSIEFLGNKLTGTKSFYDSADISDYAASAVGVMASAGIINGDNGYFLPKDDTQRAQAAVLIYNAMQLLEDK